MLLVACAQVVDLRISPVLLLFWIDTFSFICTGLWALCRLELADFSQALEAAEAESPSYVTTCVLVIFSAGLGGVRLLSEAFALHYLDANDLAAANTAAHAIFVFIAAVFPHHAHAPTLAALHRFRVQRRRSFRVAHHRLPSVVAVGRGRPSEPGPVRALAGRRDRVPAGGHGLRRGRHRTDPLADDGQPRRRHRQAPAHTHHHRRCTENMTKTTGGGGFSSRSNHFRWRTATMRWTRSMP